MSNNKKIKKRTFKKILLVGVTISALNGLIGCGEKNKKEENNVIISSTEVTTEEKSTTSNNNFNNDDINVDESYKNLEYKGNGETVDSYQKENGKTGTPVPGQGSTGTPKDQKTEREIPNVNLPKKPEGKESTEIIPEKTPEYHEENELPIDEDKKDDKKQDPIEKEEFEDRTEEPDTSYDPGVIEDDEKQNNQEEPDTSYDPGIIEESSNSNQKYKYIAYKNMLMIIYQNTSLNKASSYTLTYSNTKKNI